MQEDRNENTTHETTGNENEISDYYEGLKQLEIQGYETGVKKARTALFVTAGLLFVGELISVVLAGLTLTPLLIGIALIESGIFVGLAFWTKTRPYTAIIVGLVIFVGLWILAIIASGFMGAIGGIIVRLIIISYLTRALKPAKAWEDARKNM